MERRSALEKKYNKFKSKIETILKALPNSMFIIKLDNDFISFILPLELEFGEYCFEINVKTVKDSSNDRQPFRAYELIAKRQFLENDGSIYSEIFLYRISLSGRRLYQLLSSYGQADLFVDVLEEKVLELI